MLRLHPFKCFSIHLKKIMSQAKPIKEWWESKSSSKDFFFFLKKKKEKKRKGKDNFKKS